MEGRCTRKFIGFHRASMTDFQRHLLTGKGKKAEKVQHAKQHAARKVKIALVEAEWAHFTTARSEHAARRVMATHLLLRHALIVCLFSFPSRGPPHFSLMHKNPGCSGRRFVLYTAVLLLTSPVTSPRAFFR